MALSLKATLWKALLAQAYESSLRVESGQEKSVYDNYSSSNSSSGTDKASQFQNNEPDEWVKGQEEWANATQSEKEEIRKRDAEKYGYKYDPNDYEEEYSIIVARLPLLFLLLLINPVLVAV